MTLTKLFRLSPDVTLNPCKRFKGGFNSPTLTPIPTGITSISLEYAYPDSK